MTIKTEASNPACPIDFNDQDSIRSCINMALVDYFKTMDGHDMTGLYDLVLQEVEPPLLENVMRNTRGNQSKAAKILGINRGTLRKKLKQYNMD